MISTFGQTCLHLLLLTPTLLQCLDFFNKDISRSLNNIFDLFPFEVNNLFYTKYF